MLKLKCEREAYNPTANHKLSQIEMIKLYHDKYQLVKKQNKTKTSAYADWLKRYCGYGPVAGVVMNSIFPCKVFYLFFLNTTNSVFIPWPTTAVVHTTDRIDHMQLKTE